MKVKHLYLITFFFLEKCYSYKVSNEDEICRLYPFTFAGRIKSWYQAIPTNSIHNWEHFMGVFLFAHQNYDYNELCDEIQLSRRKEEESKDDFILRMAQMYYRFHDADRPSREVFLDLCISILLSKAEQDKMIDDEHDGVPIDYFPHDIPFIQNEDYSLGIGFLPEINNNSTSISRNEDNEDDNISKEDTAFPSHKKSLNKKGNEVTNHPSEENLEISQDVIS